MLSSVIYDILLTIIQSLDNDDLNHVKNMIKERKDMFFQEPEEEYEGYTQKDLMLQTPEDDIEIIGTGNLIKFNFQDRARFAVIIPHSFYDNFIVNQEKPSGRKYIAQDIDKPDIYYTVHKNRVRFLPQQQGFSIRDIYNTSWLKNVV